MDIPLSTSSSAGSLLHHPLRTNCLSSTARQYINSYIKVHKGLPSCHCVFGRSVLEHVTKDLLADGYSLSSSSSAGSLLRHPLRTNCLSSTARQYINSYIKVHKGLPSCHCVFGRSVLEHVTRDVLADGYSLTSSSSAGSLFRHPLRTNCLSSTARQYINSYIKLKVHKGLPSCHCVFGRSVLEQCGSVRPLDVCSSAAIPDSPVRRPVRPHPRGSLGQGGQVLLDGPARCLCRGVLLAWCPDGQVKTNIEARGHLPRGWGGGLGRVRAARSEGRSRRLARLRGRPPASPSLT